MPTREAGRAGVHTCGLDTGSSAPWGNEPPWSMRCPERLRASLEGKLTGGLLGGSAWGVGLQGMTCPTPESCPHCPESRLAPWWPWPHNDPREDMGIFSPPLIDITLSPLCLWGNLKDHGLTNPDKGRFGKRKKELTWPTVELPALDWIMQ